jgi:type II secretory pathway predicted ATPase ExeA
MYEGFYGFRRRPFSLTPDPEFLYLSKQHALALAMLEYGLRNQAGFTLITGEVGAGKTTLIRHVLANMDTDCTVGVITNTHRNFGELITWIVAAFGFQADGMDKMQQYQRFVDFVATEHVRGKRVVLIVDEAQNMDVETLEELRLLSNLNVGQDLLLQLVLVGQPELAEVLARPELRQFAQRITVEHHIPALDFAETRNYIEYRLRMAGGSEELFDRYACAAIYYYSLGIPRNINNICDMALVYGFAEEKSTIDVALVLQVVRTKRLMLKHATEREEGEERQTVREMVREIKGIDIASFDGACE